jgi:GntR family transcriptional regulator
MVRTFDSPNPDWPSLSAPAVRTLFDKSPVPLYSQLAELLRQRLARGQWKIGEKLPSIEALMREFGVARVTVRQAVELLARDGLLSPQAGRGTLVTALPEPERWLRLETSLRELADVYRNDKPKLTLIEEAASLPALQPADGRAAARYHFLRRVHSRNGEAFCVISLYLDERVFELAPERFRQETVIPVLLDLPEVRIARARQTLVVTTADVEVAGHLGIALNSPVAQVRRVFTAADETVLYLGEVTYRGDYIQFEMDLRL